MADGERNDSFLSDILIKLKSFGKNSSSENKNKHGGEKKLSKAAALICVGAIVLLFALRMFAEDTAEYAQKADVSKESVSDDSGAYVHDMEVSLKEILEKVDGAGEVSVRIYIDSTTEKVLAEDSRQESEVRENPTSDGGTENSRSDSSERSTVMSSGGGISSSGSPYVVREKLPYPIGVVVVAQGARDKRVQNELYEAVKALYGLSANRIKITY